MAILTISREYGSGGRDIGRMVAERLGYRYVECSRSIAEVKKSYLHDFKHSVYTDELAGGNSREYDIDG